MTKTYAELKKENQERINALPLKWAFDSEQLAKGLAELGVSSVDEVYSFGHGGFYRRTDADLIQDTFDEIRKSEEEAMKDDDFMVDALIYELGNHEFCITYDPTEALEALSLDRNNLRVKANLSRAVERYWEKYREGDY